MLMARSLVRGRADPIAIRQAKLDGDYAAMGTVRSSSAAPASAPFLICAGSRSGRGRGDDFCFRRTLAWGPDGADARLDKRILDRDGAAAGESVGIVEKEHY